MTSHIKYILVVNLNGTNNIPVSSDDEYLEDSDEERCHYILDTLLYKNSSTDSKNIKETDNLIYDLILKLDDEDLYNNESKNKAEFSQALDSWN